MTYKYKPRTRAAYLAHPIFGGRSLRELEKLTGVHRVQLMRVFKGLVEPRDATWALIAGKMDCREKALRKAVAECQM